MATWDGYFPTRVQLVGCTRYRPLRVSPAEHQAVTTDARTRLAELRAVARALWPDRDDGYVLSELVTILSEIRGAERVLAGRDLDLT